MNLRGQRIVWVAILVSFPWPEIDFPPYRFVTCIKSIRVVFSIDFIMTRDLGVIGEFASFRGLKWRMALRIFWEIGGRARMSIDREFKVASIRTASLED